MGTVGNQRDVVSFSIIEPPRASFEPVAPKRLFFLIAILVLGFGGGAAIAFFIHQLHPVFHDARALRLATGRPVLGVVSMTWLERHKIKRTFDFSSFAVAGASLLALFSVAILLQERFVTLMHSLIWQATG